MSEIKVYLDKYDPGNQGTNDGHHGLFFLCLNFKLLSSKHCSSENLLKVSSWFSDKILLLLTNMPLYKKSYPQLEIV